MVGVDEDGEGQADASVQRQLCRWTGLEGKRKDEVIAVKSEVHDVIYVRLW